MKVDNILDIVLLVVWLAVGAAATVWSLISIKGKITDYTTTDKISISVLDDNTPEEYTMTTDDLVLMCVIADSNQPYPAAVQVNDNNIIKFNNSYFADSETAINNIWNSQLSSLADKNIQDFDISYEGGDVRWKIATY